jgi:hypothetical protein
LEWFLKLSTLYFIRLALGLREVVFTDDDDDSKHRLARQVLTLAAEVAAQQSLRDDLTSLGQSLSSNPGSDAKDQTRTDIIQAWATVLQRAAEIEVPGTKALARSQCQWNQYRQTVLMQLKTKHITQLRALMVSDHPTYDVKSASKDTLVQHMTDAKVNAAKAAENQTLKDSHETLVDKRSDDIKNINTEKDMTSDDADFTNAGWPLLSQSMSEAASLTGLDSEGQAQVLATCSTLTSALCKLPDIGLDHLVFKREGRGAVRNTDKIGTLSAMQETDAAKLKLYFRGVITPTSNIESFNSQAAAVFENVASTPTAHGAVGLSLVVTKDTMTARSWDDKRFCPALLIKQLKSESDAAKPKSKPKSKGKGKGHNSTAATSTTPTLALSLEESQHTIGGVDLKTFALVGEVPPHKDIHICVKVSECNDSIYAV